MSRIVPVPELNMNFAGGRFCHSPDLQRCLTACWKILVLFPVLSGRCGVAAVAARRLASAPGLEPARDALALWAERSGRRRAVEPTRGGLRFAFYGRVSTEEYQDPVSSRAAAGSGSRAGRRVRADRCRVLRCRAEPGAAVGAPPASRRTCGGDGRPGPRLRRDRDRGVRAGLLRQPVRADGPAI